MYSSFVINEQEKGCAMKKMILTRANFSLEALFIGAGIAIFGVLLFSLAGCSNPVESTPPLLVHERPVYKVAFTRKTTTVNLSNLRNSNVFLLKVNPSEFVVAAPKTGGAPALLRDVQDNPEPGTSTSSTALAPKDHEAAQRFNANPPPISVELPRMAQDVFVPPVIGDKRLFWVENFYHSNSFVQKSASLTASGKYGNVWVMDENVYSTNPEKMITAAQAEALSKKFDIIYPSTTNILGYEYGGGPDGNGGVDGDPKIQILVCDIVDSLGETAGILGLFWGKDFYTQAQLDEAGWNVKTNQAEIFYLNAGHLRANPDLQYTTLTHEFQHMINFNEKYVKRGKSSPTWFDEMLAVMAEDVIASLIGIDIKNPAHIIPLFVPHFLQGYYKVGITEWNVNNYSSESYGKGTAFGAYLLRNHGGANLLKNILSNNTVGIDSITAALNEISPGMDFNKALDRFGEAMIYSGRQMPEGVLTFDKTVTNTINNHKYTIQSFDIWNMNNGNSYGPLVFNLMPMEMRPHSVLLHSSYDWLNKSGRLSITLEKPANENIELYLLVR
jgi:hypothetical protein